MKNLVGHQNEALSFFYMTSPEINLAPYHRLLSVQAVHSRINCITGFTVRQHIIFTVAHGVSCHDLRRWRMDHICLYLIAAMTFSVLPRIG
jgi:hypothetical protein